MNEIVEPRVAKPGPQRELAWEEIREPGAYVEVATGTLYRLPREVLREGVAARPGTAGTPHPRYIQLSKDPFIFVLGARLMCARLNIQPNF